MPAGPTTTLGTEGNYSFAGSTDGVLTVTKAGTTLTNERVERGLLGLTYKLSTRLTRTDDGAPLAGRVVTFQVAGATVCTARTDTDGRATCGVIGVLIGVRTWTAASAGDSTTLGTDATSRL